jgi:hypothetical protein
MTFSNGRRKTDAGLSARMALDGRLAPRRMFLSDGK